MRPKWMQLLPVALACAVLPREAYSESDATEKVSLISIAQAAGPQEGVFVVTHGMNGLKPSDSLHRLAHKLRRRFPDSGVYILDWSQPSRASGWLGLPDPWTVASRIDGVAQIGADRLLEEGIDPARTTLIGHSFGVYVNHGMAVRLGGVRAAIALNPASEAAGYSLPDLREGAANSLVAYTDSPYDARGVLADAAIPLAVRPDATAVVKHAGGLPWLIGELSRSDLGILGVDRIRTRTLASTH